MFAEWMMQMDKEKLPGNVKDGESQRITNSRVGKLAKLYKQEGVDEEADPVSLLLQKKK